MMSTLRFKIIFSILCLSGLLFAKVNIDVQIGIPVTPVVIEQPRTVVVERPTRTIVESTSESEEPDFTFEEAPTISLIMPGIYVVPNCQNEVFCISGVYWTKHHNHWYKSREGHHWVHANPPERIARLPKGKYKNWHSTPEGMTPIRERHYQPAPEGMEHIHRKHYDDDDRN